MDGGSGQKCQENREEEAEGQAHGGLTKLPTDGRTECCQERRKQRAWRRGKAEGQSEQGQAMERVSPSACPFATVTDQGQPI